MKKITYYILAGILLTLTACSSDDSANDGRVPINLQANVLAVNTRAAQDIQNTVFEKNEELNVYITENIPVGGQAGASYNGKYEYKVSDDAGSLKPMSLSSPYYPMNTNHIAITAVYPKRMTNAAVQDFTVRDDQFAKSDYKASDLMFSNNITDQEKTGSPLTLEFKHKLCKININLEMYHAEGESADNSPLDGARVILKDVCRTCSFNGRTGVVDEPSNSGEVIVTTNGRDASSAIIVPQTITSRAFFRIEMANKDILNYYLPMTVNFESGKAYTFNIQVKQDGVEVNSFTVESWDTTPATVTTTQQFEN